MNVKNVKILMLFLVLLFTVVGAVSATEDVSLDKIDDAQTPVTQQTVNEELNDNMPTLIKDYDSDVNTNTENTSVSESQSDNFNTIENTDSEINNLIIANNLLSEDINITEENYSTYFDDDGVLRNDIVGNNSTIILNGNFTNKNFIFDNVNITVKNGKNTKLINTTIISRNNATLSLNNIRIENDNCNNIYAILLNSTGNIINGITMYVNSSNVLQAIRIEEDRNTIKSTKIYMNAAAADPEFGSDNFITNIPSAGILVRSSNNLLDNNEIYFNNTNSLPGATRPSIYGVAFINKAIGEYIIQNKINKGKYNVSGTDYAYALIFSGVKDTNITTGTTFFANSTKFSYGMQMGDCINNVISGTIYSFAGNKSYGIYLTANAPSISHNMEFKSLSILNIKAPEVIGLCVEGADGLKINSSTYSFYGQDVKAIDVHNDSNENISKNIFIDKLTINLYDCAISSIIMNISDVNNLNITNGKINAYRECLGLYLYDIVDGVVKNNYINIANITGGNDAINGTGSVVLQNNTPVYEVLTDDNYNTYFDENGTYIGNADGLHLGSDLYNKNLFFDRNASLNFTNLGNYIIYNGTIGFKGEITNNTKYYLNVSGINFKNVNKPVFIDELIGYFQKTISFYKCNIEITGDNITAFDLFNDKSYVGLILDFCNITMDGNNVIGINFIGNSTQKKLSIKNNIFNIIGINNATVFYVENGQYSASTFASNNITQNATNSITFHMYNVQVSGYIIQSNNIISEGEYVTVLKLFRNGTGTWYLNNNNMTLFSDNPINAINYTGVDDSSSGTPQIYNNNIIVNSNNGEVPVVYIAENILKGTVKNNYIYAYDVYGDAAVVANIITGNTPKPMNITAEHDPWVKFKENKLTFVLTNSTGAIITGNLTVFINGTELEVINNTIKYIPTTDTVDVNVMYTDPKNVYVPTNKTFTIETGKVNSNFVIIVPEENTVNKMLTLTIILQDQFSNIITGKVVNITHNNITEELDMKYGYVVYNFYPETTGEHTFTLCYLGDEEYNGTIKIQTVNVVPDKDIIINELNETIKEQNILIDSLNTTINEQRIIIDSLNTTINEQRIIIDNLNATVAEQGVIIDNLTLVIENQQDSINNLSQMVLKQSQTIKKLNDKIKWLSRKTTKIVAKKASFKASVKTKKFTIILKTVKKAPVTLKVNGKIFKATTNSQAKATFKITNLKKKGKYTATIKYAGNSNYKPSTAKVVITVI